MKKVWEITLKGKYIEQIISGQKTVEGRTGKMFDPIRVGDEIVFFNQFARVKIEVKAITKYPDLRSFLETEGVQNCLPGIKDIESAIHEYYKIPKYREKIQKFGITAIKF